MRPLVAHCCRGRRQRAKGGNLVSGVCECHSSVQFSSPEAAEVSIRQTFSTQEVKDQWSIRFFYQLARCVFCLCVCIPTYKSIQFREIKCVPYFKISEHSVGDDTMCCAVICSSVQHGYFCYWRIYRAVCIILTQHVFLTSPDRQQQQHNRDTGERCLVDTWRTTRFLRITMRHGRQYNGVCVRGKQL